MEDHVMCYSTSTLYARAARVNERRDPGHNRTPPSQFSLPASGRSRQYTGASVRHLGETKGKIGREPSEPPANTELPDATLAKAWGRARNRALCRSGLWRSAGLGSGYRVRVSPFITA
jgi:hypothetical protein